MFDHFSHSRTTLLQASALSHTHTHTDDAKIDFIATTASRMQLGPVTRRCAWVTLPMKPNDSKIREQDTVSTTMGRSQEKLQDWDVEREGHKGTEVGMYQPPSGSVCSEPARSPAGSTVKLRYKNPGNKKELRCVKEFNWGKGHTYTKMVKVEVVITPHLRCRQKQIVKELDGKIDANVMSVWWS